MCGTAWLPPAQTTQGVQRGPRQHTDMQLACVSRSRSLHATAAAGHSCSLPHHISTPTSYRPARQIQPSVVRLSIPTAELQHPHLQRQQPCRVVVTQLCTNAHQGRGGMRCFAASSSAQCSLSSSGNSHIHAACCGRIPRQRRNQGKDSFSIHQQRHSSILRPRVTAAAAAASYSPFARPEPCSAIASPQRAAGNRLSSSGGSSAGAITPQAAAAAAALTVPCSALPTHQHEEQQQQVLQHGSAQQQARVWLPEKQLWVPHPPAAAVSSPSNPLRTSSNTGTPLARVFMASAAVSRHPPVLPVVLPVCACCHVRLHCGTLQPSDWSSPQPLWCGHS